MYGKFGISTGHFSYNKPKKQIAEVSMDTKNNGMRDKTPAAEFTLIPDDGTADVHFLEKTVPTELSCDFTLPDYLPEIRKMLRTKARISPISRYIGAGNAEFSGRVDYDIIYMCEDGSLASAPLGDDFSFDVNFELPSGTRDDAPEIFAAVCLDAVYCRVTAPRKVNIRSRIRAEVNGYCRTDIAPTVPVCKSKAEKLTENAKCTIARHVMSDVIDLSGEISSAGDDEKSICASGTVCITESAVTDGLLQCRGNLYIKMLTQSGEDVRTNEIRIPFTEQTELDGDERPCHVAYVTGKCGEIKVEQSDEGKFLLDTEVTLEALIACESETEIVDDIFIPNHKTDVTYTLFTSEEMGKCGCGTVRIDEKHPFSDFSVQMQSGVTPEITDSDITIKTDSVSVDEGHCMINGTCRIWVLTRSGNEYASGETSIPFSFDTELSAPDDASPKMYASATPIACNCTAGADGVICSAEIGISYCITLPHEYRIAENVTLPCGGEITAKQNGVTICYPREAETLWDISKRYGVPLRTVAELNSIPSPVGSTDVSGLGHIIIC